MSKQIWLIIALLAGLSHAFIEDVIEEDQPEETTKDPDEKKVLAFNDDMVRCYAESAKNISAMNYDGPLATCCLRDYWSICIRRVPLAKECSAVLETRIEEFESSMVQGVDCSTVDTRSCPHIEGHNEHHTLVLKERIQRYTGASTAAHAGLTTVFVAIVILTKNTLPQIL